MPIMPFSPAVYRDRQPRWLSAETGKMPIFRRRLESRRSQPDLWH
jgi:hypothetical protein